MKILEIITFLGSGGAERFVVDLSNELSKNNEVFLLTILDDKKDMEIRSFYKFAINENVHYINLGLPNGLKLQSQNAVKQAIQQINPDVVHYHLVPTLKYSAFALFTLSNKYRTYFTVHSDLKNGYDNGFMKVACKTLGTCGKIKLACLSQKNYQDFKSYYSKTEIRCIVNGRAPITPTDAYIAVQKEMQSYRQNAQSVLLIHVARFHPVKNQNLLVDAFNNLCNDGVNADLVIIGSGYDSSEATQLRHKANRRIHFVGPKKNISDYVLNGDIFCLSSDFEGMPISLLEASLAGVPAVSTPVCGAVDLIKDGINGILSTGHSVEEYKQAILKAINNFNNLKKNAMKMKENSPYTIAECASKYLDYFKE